MLKRVDRGSLNGSRQGGAQPLFLRGRGGCTARMVASIRSPKDWTRTWRNRRLATARSWGQGRLISGRSKDGRVPFCQYIVPNSVLEREKQLDTRQKPRKKNPPIRNRGNGTWLGFVKSRSGTVGINYTKMKKEKRSCFFQARMPRVSGLPQLLTNQMRGGMGNAL